MTTMTVHKLIVHFLHRDMEIVLVNILARVYPIPEEFYESS